VSKIGAKRPDYKAAGLFTSLAVKTKRITYWKPDVLVRTKKSATDYSHTNNYLVNMLLTNLISLQ
jgi:hypothetical protein